MTGPSDKTLLLGLGSDVMSDAGIGPKLAAEVYGQCDLEKHDLKTSIVGGLDLLQIMAPYKKVIIFDGILSKNKAVGEVSIFQYPDCPNSLHLSSGHDADFSMLKDIAAVSGVPFPDEIVIITVTVEDPFTISDEFSDTLKGEIYEILVKIQSLLTT